MTTITNCYFDAAGTSAIALRARRITCADFIVSSFRISQSQSLQHADISHAITLETENPKRRFAKMLSRSNLTGLFDNWRTTMAKAEAPLPKYFNATSAGKDWHLHCKKCGQGWALPKDNKHPGNVLHLLNHARSHDEPKRGKRAALAAINDFVAEEIA